MGFYNISNGKNDGYVLFYLKGGKLCNVLLTQNQIETLALALKIGFGDDKVSIMQADPKVIKGYLK